MTAIVNGIQYIGGGTAPNEFIPNQSATIDGTQTIENAVLAGPITIPAAGATINLTTENLSIYKDIIERYENNKLEVVAGEIYINDKVATTYTFAMDYFWMMGDNRHNSADSRFWGFVPENHIVGKALFVWMSWDKNAEGLKKIRWSRLFSSVK